MVTFSDFNRENTNSEDNIFIDVSKDYRVYLNGEEIPVYTCRISAYPFNTWWPGHQRPVNQTEIVSYVNIISDEEIEIEVEPLTKTAYERVMIKPYNKGIEHKKRGERIAFSLKQNGGYLFELDDYHGCLYIFNNKPCPCEDTSKATHYFGAGVHFAEKIVLKSNESIYLDKDALVYGCVFAEKAENIRIYGNGIFDDSKEERIAGRCYSKKTANGNMKFFDCRNVKIEGVGMMNSAIWCLNLFHCFNVEVNGVNIFGQWRYNTDGIDIVNSRNVAIQNCFVHSFDDTIVIKGIDKYAFENNADILVDNCVLLCDWGRTMELGFETECSEYNNITFKGCDVIRGGAFVCSVHNGDRATIHNVTFEDISVELESFYTPMQLQENQEQNYSLKDLTEKTEILRVENSRFREAYSFISDIGDGDKAKLGDKGYAAAFDIKVKNVRIYADEKILSNMGTKCVKIHIYNKFPTTEYRNLSVENVFLNGNKLSRDDMLISVDGCKEEVLEVK